MCRSVVGQRTQLDICEKTDISRWPPQILMAVGKDSARNLCNFIILFFNSFVPPLQKEGCLFPIMTAVAASLGSSALPFGIHVHIWAHSHIIFQFFLRSDQNAIVVWRVFAFRDRGEYPHSHVWLPEVIERKVPQTLAGTWTRVKQHSWMTRQTISQLS